MPRKITYAKIACLDFPLEKTEMFSGNSLVDIRREEIEITKCVEKIIRSGANLVCRCLIYRNDACDIL